MEYILGVVVSIVVEVVKKYVGTSKLGTLTTLLALSLVGGWLFVLVSSTAYWQVLLQVLGAAAAFHNLVIRQYQELSK